MAVSSRSVPRFSKTLRANDHDTDMTEPRKLLILVGSPRCAGNSATLAKAVQRGAEATGAQVTLRFLDDFISSFLRDCRLCRLPNGECSIADQLD